MIFHSCVSLPEGNNSPTWNGWNLQMVPQSQPWRKTVRQSSPQLWFLTNHLQMDRFHPFSTAMLHYQSYIMVYIHMYISICIYISLYVYMIYIYIYTSLYVYMRDIYNIIYDIHIHIYTYCNGIYIWSIYVYPTSSYNFSLHMILQWCLPGCRTITDIRGQVQPSVSIIYVLVGNLLSYNHSHSGITKGKP